MATKPDLHGTGSSRGASKPTTGGGKTTSSTRFGSGVTVRGTDRHGRPNYDHPAWNGLSQTEKNDVFRLMAHDAGFFRWEDLVLAERQGLADNPREYYRRLHGANYSDQAYDNRMAHYERQVQGNPHATRARGVINAMFPEYEQDPTGTAVATGDDAQAAGGAGPKGRHAASDKYNTVQLNRAMELLLGGRPTVSQHSVNLLTPAAEAASSYLAAAQAGFATGNPQYDATFDEFMRSSSLLAQTFPGYQPPADIVFGGLGAPSDRRQAQQRGFVGANPLPGGIATPVGHDAAAYLKATGIQVGSGSLVPGAASKPSIVGTPGAAGTPATAPAASAWPSDHQYFGASREDFIEKQVKQWTALGVPETRARAQAERDADWQVENYRATGNPWLSKKSLEARKRADEWRKKWERRIPQMAQRGQSATRTEGLAPLVPTTPRPVGVKPPKVPTAPKLTTRKL